MPDATYLSISKRPHGVDAAYFLHPDHATTRTLSPRRGRSSAPKSPQIGLREPEDPYDLGEIYSIGNVSVEPQPWQSATSINSTGSDTRKSIRTLRSIRSLRSLGLKSSRDSLRSEDEKVVRKSKRGRQSQPERLMIKDSTPPGSPPQDRVAVSKRDDRHSATAEAPTVPERASSVQSCNTPRKLYWNADDIMGDRKLSNGVLNQECIPTRESSKRQSMRLSSTNQRRNSRWSQCDSSEEVKSVSAEDNDPVFREGFQRVANTSKFDHEHQSEATEDSVNRRIKELKEQKMQRERSSVETSTESVSAPDTLNCSLTPSPLPLTSQPVTANLAAVGGGSRGSVPVNVQGTEDDGEKSAPSPAIASRTKRSSLVGSRPIKDPLTAAVNENKRRSFSAPQRSNSRLLRRLSRPASPTTAEKHRKTFSNSMNESLFDQPEMGDQDSAGHAVRDFLTAPRLNQTVKQAQTGRMISFSEVGDPKGSVVFCCVGMGLTRFLTAFYDELALTLRLRLITPDRPGVGGSESHADGLDTPLGWPDDVRAICEYLKITKFSIMAHSAGAIYALATTLRMSQHIRCRVHLLAPWIPPSQMSVIGTQQEPLPATALPYSQRILRALPTTFLRAANSSFLSTTSASITTSLPKSPRRNKRRNSQSEVLAPELDKLVAEGGPNNPPPQVQKNGTEEDYYKENRPPLTTRSTSGTLTSSFVNEKEVNSNYETRLTEAIWEAATTGANPAVDLLVCLERRQPIGFRYVDITRAIVIHHGSKDTRVPVENAKWLGKTMRKCQVRVLEGEGHGLMASAGVMGNVLMEMAQEWDDWNRVVKGKGPMERRVTSAV